MLDGRDFAAVHGALRAQDDRSAGALIFTAENLALGNDQMHPHAIDAVDGFDGAGEFAFQRAQPVNVLHEGCGAEEFVLSKIS